MGIRESLREQSAELRLQDISLEQKENLTNKLDLYLNQQMQEKWQKIKEYILSLNKSTSTYYDQQEYLLHLEFLKVNLLDLINEIDQKELKQIFERTLQIFSQKLTKHRNEYICPEENQEQDILNLLALCEAYKTVFQENDIIPKYINFDQILNFYSNYYGDVYKHGILQCLKSLTIIFPDKSKEIFSLANNKIEDFNWKNIVEEIDEEFINAEEFFSDKKFRELDYEKSIYQSRFDDFIHILKLVSYIRIISSKNYRKFEKQIVKIKKLIPRFIDHFNELVENNKSIDLKSFQEIFFYAKIVNADKIKITDQGLEFEMTEKKESHQQQIPPRPERRQF